MAEQSKSQSQEVSNVTSSGTMAKMQKFGDALTARATIEESEIDGKEIAAQIAAKVLEADSVDAIFAISEGGMPGGRDLVDVEQRILSITVRRGKNDEIKNDLIGGNFLVVQAIRLDTGEPITWDTSATQLVAQLIALEHHDALAQQAGKPPVIPIDVKIVDVGGKGALALRKVAKRAV